MQRTSNDGMTTPVDSLNRAETQTTKQNLDLMVAEYVRNKHCNELRWKVVPALGVEPLTICVQVEKRRMSSPEVRVSCNEETLFPSPLSGHTKEALHEDFSYCWPFRGEVEGIRRAGVYEVRLRLSGGVLQWFAATITKQRDDGLLEVRAYVPHEAGGTRELDLPAMHADDLRNKETEEPLKLQARYLMLKVPHSNPLDAVLRVDGESVAKHLAWPFQRALASGALGSCVPLQVSSDRKRVSANVGHGTLSHFLSGEIRAKARDRDQQHRQRWTIQVGPLTEHTIELERKANSSKILELKVDGLPFVQASAQDLDCSGAWECSFRLVGERVLDFDVPETDKDGHLLARRAHVKQPCKYSHMCSVRLPVEGDLRAATLAVDGVHFEGLARARRACVEDRLEMQSEAFQFVYGLAIPFHVNETPPNVLQATYESMAVAVQDYLPSLFACSAVAAQGEEEMTMVKKV
jgi:hypothetical protein